MDGNDTTEVEEGDRGKVIVMEEQLGACIEHVALGGAQEDNTAHHMNENADCGQDKLLPEQRVAFDIIENHLIQTLAKREPDQLLMQIHGQGGTGKSKLIHTVTKAFEMRGCADMLARSAYTGITASLIDGKTLHTLAGIPLNGHTPSANAISKLARQAANRKYLIIDEISMISRGFLARLHTILGKVADALGRNEAAGHAPFGGLNVILVGDLHQFPPVVARKRAPLYYSNVPGDTQEDHAGRLLYEKFNKVIILKKQARVVDQRWRRFLNKARKGRCSPGQLRMVRRLVIGSKGKRKIDFSKPPWDKAVLITPPTRYA